MKLVIIDWLDSRTPLTSWMFASDLPEFTAVHCRSVGWLVRQDEAMTVLAANLGDVDSDDRQVSGIMQIPTCCVVKTIHIETAPTDEEGAAETGRAATLLDL